MSKIEPYLHHLENICGGEGRFFKITSEGEFPPVTVISYDNIPEDGCATAFSFGLSSVVHQEWVHSRPELIISVNSLDLAWPLAMGEIIRNGRDKCLFSYGTIINFGERISDDSGMSSFLVFACTVLDPVDLAIQLEDRKIHLSQIYPVYQSESRLIKEIGPERFVTASGIDLFDVKRPPSA